MKEIHIDQEKYERILQAALVQFAAGGYQKASTDKIAVEAEVSKGLIFHYFGKKQVLYEKTISHVIDFLNEQSQDLFLKNYTDLVEVVVVSTQHKLKLEQKYPEYIHLLISAYAEKETLPKEIQMKLSLYLEQNMESANKLFQNIVKQLPIKADITEQDVVQLVSGVFHQIYTESLYYLNTHPEITEIKQLQFLAERAEIYMNILQNGFLMKKTSES
ncbi:TetR/AcrR family transcriptional regulator [Enterococcus sp. 5H]|uniref:TetR/AcrR family transcriptional regulator n=1 Tax=Enterococcus sp. 5H TaxID=1229490 RepID=UPI002304A71A|nr:TetR/AcrR family transcriptional regulator [Enterococcus sp. 5H]MDA9470486.1 transcriptional regulator, TetR family [Enterococcus sp. 5H]